MITITGRLPDLARARARSTIRPRGRPVWIATCRWSLRRKRAIMAARFIRTGSRRRIPQSPTRIKDAGQLAIEQKFLTSGFISVDIFAASPVEKGGTAMIRRAATGPQLSSGSAVGEEAEQQGDTFIREVGNVAAPLDQAQPKFAPGSTARVDVVVQDAQDRALLPRRHARFFRYLAGTGSHRCHRQSNLLERPGGRRRQRPG